MGRNFIYCNVFHFFCCIVIQHPPLRQSVAGLYMVFPRSFVKMTKVLKHFNKLCATMNTVCSFLKRR